MNDRIKVMVFCGTRPAIIKMAPVILELKSDDRFECIVVNSGQHGEIASQAFSLFEIKPDFDLLTLENSTNLANITGHVLENSYDLLEIKCPDIVLVHGDTQTAFSSALAAFYHQIPVGHVEAGLRSFDMFSPFPEESNRVFIDKIGKLLFSPTETASNNLRNECIQEEKIFEVGNTVIDAQKIILGKTVNWAPKTGAKQKAVRRILMTSHRRENLGEGQKKIFKAIAKIALRYPLKGENAVEITFPIHPNPKIRKLADKYLSEVDNVSIVEPLPFDELTKLMSSCYLIITDSGGIQEEAPSLKVPVLVTRDTTERPEGIKAGVAKLVGTDADAIFLETCKLLDDETAYKAMIADHNPYGDGNSSKRIAEILSHLKD